MKIHQLLYISGDRIIWKKKNFEIFNILDERYYNDCIKEISIKITAPVFYVFSEDIDWAKQNINFLNNNFIFVSDKVKIDYLEFDLMRQCKHIITANSTFSWWAAELNDNRDKLIYAPKKYYKNEELQHLYISKVILFNPKFIYVEN